MAIDLAEKSSSTTPEFLASSPPDNSELGLGASMWLPCRGGAHFGVALECPACSIGTQLLGFSEVNENGEIRFPSKSMLVEDRGGRWGPHGRGMGRYVDVGS